MVLGPMEQNAWPVSMFAIGTGTVVAADPEMLRLYGQIERLARTQLPILIGGESGVGKEHAALAVHAWSTRAAGPFVTLHCAALQDALLDGELFGYERGAFLGVVTGKAGLLERADGGTLFLDEVSALSPTAQLRLLRVLEDQRVTRLGGSQERALDIRIVAATSCDLAAEVAAERFRGDLYFRLNGAGVVLPPLRARRIEIAILAQHFLAAACANVQRDIVTLSPAALQRLNAHAWAGNVRELKHAMAYAAALVDGDRVEPWHLPEAVVEPKDEVRASLTTLPPAAPDGTAAEAVRSPDSFRPVAEELRALERRRMIEALRATGGVQRRAARLIGMPVRTFTCKLTQYDLRDRSPEAAAPSADDGSADDDRDGAQLGSASRAISALASVTGGEHVGPLHTKPRAVSPAGVLPSRIDGAAHGPAMHKVGT
jgi:two-component system, NtrC family, response regulator AtoC